ncbi:MAG: hypothetical protein KDK36_20770 [Leptospiraceae bacterium]|nr:hypothetical protein [Leptospiraceae bacterium]
MKFKLILILFFLPYLIYTENIKPYIRPIESGAKKEFGFLTLEKFESPFNVTINWFSNKTELPIIFMESYSMPNQKVPFGVEIQYYPTGIINYITHGYIINYKSEEMKLIQKGQCFQGSQESFYPTGERKSHWFSNCNEICFDCKINKKESTRCGTETHYDKSGNIIKTIQHEERCFTADYITPYLIKGARYKVRVPRINLLETLIKANFSKPSDIFLEKGKFFTVIENRSAIQTINGKTARIVKVKYDGNKEGYIFGTLADLEGPY